MCCYGCLVSCLNVSWKCCIHWIMKSNFWKHSSSFKPYSDQLQNVGPDTFIPFFPYCRNIWCNTTLCNQYIMYCDWLKLQNNKYHVIIVFIFDFQLTMPFYDKHITFESNFTKSYPSKRNLSRNVKIKECSCHMQFSLITHSIYSL